MRKLRTSLVILLMTVLLLPSSASSVSFITTWTGYDPQTDNYIEIEIPDGFTIGTETRMYDYSTESFHMATIWELRKTDTGFILKVYDNDLHRFRTFEMEIETEPNVQT